MPKDENIKFKYNVLMKTDEKKNIIEEYLTNLKNESSLAPRLDPQVERTCNRINELCYLMSGNRNENYQWIETGLPEPPKYIKYSGTGKWYIKSNEKWTFIPNDLNSFINNLKID